MVIIKNMDIDVWSTFDLGILVPVLKRWEHQTSLPVSWKTCMQVKKQQIELARNSAGEYQADE